MCATVLVCEHPRFTSICLWLSNDRNVLYVSQSERESERDRNFRMKTASVTVIIVRPHFIVTNGNGVVTGETVISLITRY